QGGSTITQQIVKNLLVGEDLTYDRKIREMIVASRVEHTLSKAEILEHYFNPDRHPGRAQERLAYVFSRMQEDETNAAAVDQPRRGLPALPTLVPYER